jgi:hypothetical protein
LSRPAWADGAGKSDPLHVLSLGQMQLQVFTDKTIGTGDENLHSESGSFCSAEQDRLQTGIHRQQIQPMAQGRGGNQRIWKLHPARSAQLNCLVFDDSGNCKVRELGQPLPDQGIFVSRDLRVAQQLHARYRAVRALVWYQAST